MISMEKSAWPTTGNEDHASHIVVRSRNRQRAGQSAIGSEHEHSVILFLRQGVNSFGDLHRGRHLVREQPIAPLTYEGHTKEERTTELVRQGLGPLVTDSGLGRSESPGDDQTSLSFFVPLLESPF
jgi:hypothetical protein